MLDDYYCTPDSWSVKTSASRVIAAANSWLHAETRRTAEDRDRGYVCTLSALILKGTVAHLFHVGDARISRLAGRSLERLTEDHRLAIGADQTYLARALGIAPYVEIDYRAIPLEPGDLFVLTTDGIHDHLSAETIAAELATPGVDLDRAARTLAARALAAGSTDDRTVQLLRIETLPAADRDRLQEEAADLPPAPLLEPGAFLDGHRVLRTLHDSARSHLYLVAEPGGGLAVMKIPSIDLRANGDYLRHFMLEEWVARRIASPHVLKPRPAPGRSAVYLLFDYLEGQTLAQWMRDHPTASVETVRAIVDQLARGLDAFHRREMVHGDLRPENVMIDPANTVRIIDFGSVRVAGVAELADREEGPRGTAQYSAPECLLGAPATSAADIYALAAIAYHALAGRLPYGALPARLKKQSDLRRLTYRPVRLQNPAIPAWVDAALAQALSPNPAERPPSAADFAQDLRHPNPSLATSSRPLAQRDPVRFWQAISLILALALLALAAVTLGPR